MKPLLYAPNDDDFENNGIGILNDCSVCVVTEELNGIFELEMEYPMDGIHFCEISDRSIVKVRPNQYAEPQLFRVYSIEKSGMSGIAKISAQHISYDLSGVPVSPFTASGVASALNGLGTHSATGCPFEFWTDKTTAADFSVKVPASIRSRLAGNEGSILDVYGGEYEFDNFVVRLHNNRGLNRGVSIRYGKNLTDIDQERNCSNVYTGVYPFWADIDYNNVVELPEKIINAEGYFGYSKIHILDLSAEFVEQPTEEQIRMKAQKYIANNDIGKPKVSLDIKYAQLANSEEYKHLRFHERVSLGDEVNVEFPLFGVSTTAKVVKIEYDAILERVESATIGSVRANISDTIAESNKEIANAPSKSDLAKAQEEATKWLTNGEGYAYFRKDDFGNIEDILFMDTQDPNTAINVMRVGQSGIGFSHNGVNGPYESAWTIDGRFVADFITAGTINGSLIRTGTIKSADNTLAIDLGEGNITVQSQNSGYTEISSQGITLWNADGTVGLYLRRMVGYFILRIGNNVNFRVDLDDVCTLSLQDFDNRESYLRLAPYWKKVNGVYTLVGEDPYPTVTEE